MAPRKPSIRPFQGGLFETVIKAVHKDADRFPALNRTVTLMDRKASALKEVRKESLTGGISRIHNKRLGKYCHLLAPI